IVFGRPDAEHLRDRGHRLILARIVGPHLGDHTDSALTKLARILTGTSHKTDPSKESCLRTHRASQLDLTSASAIVLNASAEMMNLRATVRHSAVVVLATGEAASCPGRFVDLRKLSVR